MAERQQMVSLEQVRAAVAAVEQQGAAGRMSEREVTRRVNDCRRAVTPRDLWRASGGLAGSRRRSDWADLRKTAFGLLGLLIMMALGVWLVTWTLGLLHGTPP